MAKKTLSKEETDRRLAIDLLESLKHFEKTPSGNYRPTNETIEDEPEPIDEEDKKKQTRKKYEETEW